jgi:hypothetical protein
MKLSVISTVLLVLLSTSTITPQEPPPVAAEVPTATPQGRGNDQWQREQMRKMQKEQKALRYKQLKADTDKLLELATELKTSVDKTNEHVLSLDVVKKAEEIEKLAKHIKTNMRDEMR